MLPPPALFFWKGTGDRFAAERAHFADENYRLKVNAFGKDGNRIMLGAHEQSVPRLTLPVNLVLA